MRKLCGLAVSVRAMLREALPVEYEDNMCLSANQNEWYLQVSFSHLHPLISNWLGPDNPYVGLCSSISYCK